MLNTHSESIRSMASKVVERLATPAAISVIPLLLAAFKGLDAASAFQFIKPIDCFKEAFAISSASLAFKFLLFYEMNSNSHLSPASLFISFVIEYHDRLDIGKNNKNE